MTLIHAENFDAPTPPALPSSWNSYGSGWETATSGSGPISPTSSPNLCQLVSTASGVYYLTYGAATDGFGGYCEVVSNINSDENNPGVAGVFARGNSSTLGSSATAYLAWFNFNLGTLNISKAVSGTITDLMTALQATGSWNEWLTITLTCEGTLLEVSLQRISDGFWLNSVGTWQSTMATAISLSDSSITGAGYAGLYAKQIGADVNMDWDDWSFYALNASNAPLPRVVVVELPIGYYPAYRW